jgi:hypothetical protein
MRGVAKVDEKVDEKVNETGDERVKILLTRELTGRLKRWVVFSLHGLSTRKSTQKIFLTELHLRERNNSATNQWDPAQRNANLSELVVEGHPRCCKSRACRTVHQKKPKRMPINRNKADLLHLNLLRGIVLLNPRKIRCCLLI